jgi:hypothetical protein
MLTVRPTAVENVRTRGLAAFEHAAATIAMPVHITPVTKWGRDPTLVSTPPTAEAILAPLLFVTGE